MGVVKNRRVKTVDYWTFLKRLEDELYGVSNSVLADKIGGTPNKMGLSGYLIASKSVLDGYAAELRERKSFWNGTDFERTVDIAEKLINITGTELPESQLVAMVSMVSPPPYNELYKAVLRVSEPYFVLALVEDRVQAKEIIKRFDVELGRIR